MTQYKDIILVTGGAGFIGSNWLNTIVPREPDCLFINVDCLTYAGNLANLTVTDEPNYVFSQTTICDRAALEQVFATYRPTKIIHFAAESHVDKSLESADAFIATNVVGTQNLLNLAREYAVTRFHQISTDEVYGALGLADAAFTETSPLQPRNPYSASKAAADLLALAAYHTYGLDVVITRSSNIYGPNQDATKLIPRFITALAAGESVPLYGQGAQVREWTYVDDVVAAIYAVFTKGKSGEVYNIGSGHELSNLELTKQLLAAFNTDESAIAYVPDRVGHDFRYALNPHKIQTELGWQAEVDFTEGLKHTIDFYQPTL